MNTKKFIAALVVVCLLCFTGTALAAEPDAEPETDTQTGRAMVVTIEDITAVMEQLEDYDKEIDMLAQLVYAEARGVNSKAEQAAVIWCVLNRFDAGHWGDTIAAVVKGRSQFAYASGLPVRETFRELAQDVMIRWLLEKRGITSVGRVLPSNYYYFSGHGGHNWFRKSYRSGGYWDWSLPDPYRAPAISAASAG